ncbi:kinase-like protein, partial [Hymenopellis radicata]
DLKAENVLVEENGRCKITCFGVSKRIDDLGARTKTPVHGSVFWMAPEAMSLERQSGAGVKVDVWSIGCIACEMWAG